MADLNQKWEYHAVDATDWPTPEQLTSKFGGDGWEVVGFYPRDGNLTIYFKRPTRKVNL